MDNEAEFGLSQVQPNCRSKYISRPSENHDYKVIAVPVVIAKVWLSACLDYDNFSYKWQGSRRIAFRGVFITWGHEMWIYFKQTCYMSTTRTARFDCQNSTPISALSSCTTLLCQSPPPPFAVQEHDVTTLFKYQSNRKAAGPDDASTSTLKHCSN